MIRVPTRSHDVVDLRTEVPDDATRPVDISGGWILLPGGTCLASTIEYLDIPRDLVCRIEGKSSLARLFLQVHSAGFIDPGFRGNATLEMVNFGSWPIRLWPGILIAQLSFEYLSSPCAKPYQGRYQDSRGVVASRFNRSDGFG